MKKTEYKRILSLSYSLAKANFKVRNEASYLGILWYLLNPLSFFLIILYLRGALFSAENIAYYPAYLLVGLIMMNFFTQAVSSSIDLIRNNGGFIKSIKIHYEVFVLSTLFQSAFSHIFEFLLVAVLFLFLHISLVGLLGYIVVFIFFALFTLGLCFLFSTIGLYFSDFGNIWSIASQLLFFITPIFYVVSQGSYIYKGNLINPLFYYMTVARDIAIYHIVPSAELIIVSCVIPFVSLAVGVYFFRKFKNRFAEFV